MQLADAIGALPPGDKLRIIQELVPGRQVTLAHLIANPDPVLYQKLGLDPSVDSVSYTHLLNPLPFNVPWAACLLAVPSVDRTKTDRRKTAGGQFLKGGGNTAF